MNLPARNPKALTPTPLDLMGAVVMSLETETGRGHKDFGDITSISFRLKSGRQVDVHIPEQDTDEKYMRILG